MNLSQTKTQAKSARTEPAQGTPGHDWWRMIGITYVPNKTTPLINYVAEHLLRCFQENGHELYPSPQEGTDVILTTAVFGEPVRWRDALLFTSRRRYRLEHAPAVFTLLHARPDQFKGLLDHYEISLQKEPPDPKDFEFPGLAPEAYHTLVEQGRRGGPMLALLRTLQTQSLSIRVILLVGDERPLEAYTFDLVGAHPRTSAEDEGAFYSDLVSRIVTAASTGEVTSHQVVGEPIPDAKWRELSTPAAMRIAGRELGERSFFTQMVKVDNLAHVPALHDAISSQYSEGCFATWDARLNALMTTVTGSARPVVKENLTDDELAVIVGVREDGRGALVRHVVGKRNDPPSSEAVELMEMDAVLPRLRLSSAAGDFEVPIARSKLHGHRGVRAYNPAQVEHVYLDSAYYHYPVSCSTEAQARAIQSAFSRSAALNDPDDPRQVIFTVLPGHGIVIVEKWVAGKEPFQVMWEYMDAGRLQIENRIPQGPLTFIPGADGMMVLQTL
ncbi:MAG TPA: hypothetical protein VJ436_12935 [Anaerolineales bacterium]|nr:hypothetical protein [Anaerolineales bacterium]